MATTSRRDHDRRDRQESARPRPTRGVIRTRRPTNPGVMASNASPIRSTVSAMRMREPITERKRSGTGVPGTCLQSAAGHPWETDPFPPLRAACETGAARPPGQSFDVSG